MKKFAFRRPDDSQATTQNWEHLIEHSRLFEFNPFYPSDDPAGAGWNEVDDWWGTYHVFGPIVYFNVCLLPVPGGLPRITWVSGASLRLPIAYAKRDPLFGQQHGLSFPMTYYGNWLDNGFGTPHIMGGNSVGQSIFAAYGEATGTVDILHIAGQYYRD